MLVIALAGSSVTGSPARSEQMVDPPREVGRQRGNAGFARAADLRMGVEDQAQERRPAAGSGDEEHRAGSA